MKNRHRLLILLLTAFIFAFNTSAVYAAEMITVFSSCITIDDDSTVTVKEEITVNAEGKRIKRGIMRAIPVRYSDMDGKRRETTFSVNSLMLDGDECSYEQTTESGITYILLGNSDNFLRPGLHTFTLVYEMRNTVNYFEDYDELYWNVTGNAWSLPILKASCTLTLPDMDEGEGLRSSEAYAGHYGSKGRPDYVSVKGNTVSTRKVLRPGEGLTAVYTWDKGITEPPFWNAKREGVLHKITAYIVLALILIWNIFAWFVWGKDPSRKAIIPLFTPGRDSSPASVKMARDFVTDKTSLTANILDLAVRGYLRIEQQEQRKLKRFHKTTNDYVLCKLKEAGEGKISLPRDEKAVLNALFDRSSRLELNDDSDRSALTEAMTVLKAHMEARAGNWFRLNTDKALISVIIMLLGTAVVFWFSEYDTTDLFYCGAMTIVTFITGLKDPTRRENKKLVFTALLMIRLLIILLAGGSLIFICTTGLNGCSSCLTLSAYIAAACIATFFRPLLAARTAEGFERLNEADGLALYMETAEKERLEMLNPPDETPELFEKLLPYALSLGVAKTWADRFADVIRTYEQDPAGDSAYQPSWVSSYMLASALSDSDTFVNDFTTAIDEYCSATENLDMGGKIMSDRDSFGGFGGSGFGGSGFSGGGFGGGGGDGW